MIQGDFWSHVTYLLFIKYPKLGDIYGEILERIDSSISETIYELDYDAPFPKLEIEILQDKYIHPLVIRYLIHSFLLSGWKLTYEYHAIDVNNKGHYNFTVTRKIGVTNDN